MNANIDKLLTVSNASINSVETVIVTGNVLGAGIGASTHTTINFATEFSHLFEKLNWINNPTHAAALFTIIAGGMWIGYGVLIFIQELLETIYFYQQKESAEYQAYPIEFWFLLISRIFCLNLVAPCFVFLMGLSMLGVISFAGLPILVHLAPIILILYALWQLVKNNKDEQKSSAPLSKLVKTALLLLLIVLMLAVIYTFSAPFFIATLTILVNLAAIVLYVNSPKIDDFYENKKLPPSFIAWAVLAIIIISLLALYLAAPALLAITFSTLVFSAIALSLLIIALSWYFMQVAWNRAVRNARPTKPINKWVVFRHYMLILSIATILLILIGFYVFAPALLFIVLAHVVLLILTITLSIHSTVDIYRTYRVFKPTIFKMSDKVLGSYMAVSVVLLLAALIIATLPLYSSVSLITAVSIVSILLGCKLFIIFLSNLVFCYKLNQVVNPLKHDSYGGLNKNKITPCAKLFSELAAMSPAYFVLAMAFMVIGSLYGLSILSTAVVVPILLAAILFFVANEIRMKVITLGANKNVFLLDSFTSGAAIMVLSGIVALMVIHAVAPPLLIMSAIAVAAAFFGYCLFYLAHAKMGNSTTEIPNDKIATNCNASS